MIKKRGTREKKTIAPVPIHIAIKNEHLPQRGKEKN